MERFIQRPMNETLRVIDLDPVICSIFCNEHYGIYVMFTLLSKFKTFCWINQGGIYYYLFSSHISTDSSYIMHLDTTNVIVYKNLLLNAKLVIQNTNIMYIVLCFYSIVFVFQFPKLLQITFFLWSGNMLVLLLSIHCLIQERDLHLIALFFAAAKLGAHKSNAF